MEQVKQNQKRKFTPATIAKRESKAEGAITIKKERRSYYFMLGLGDLCENDYYQLSGLVSKQGRYT
jgi:hypothetical protein